MALWIGAALLSCTLSFLGFTFLVGTGGTKPDTDTHDYTYTHTHILTLIHMHVYTARGVLNWAFRIDSGCIYNVKQAFSSHLHQ